MTYRVAHKLNENFSLDEKFNIILADTDRQVTEPMHKGYIYANLYFYDEVQKEIDKLRKIVRNIHDELTLEHGISADDPIKLLSEISVRVRLVVGEDSLDALVKELLAEKSKHMALMIDDQEAEKLMQISEAIFMELTSAFFDMTLQNARDLEGGVKTFRFSKEYVEKMTVRQKHLLAPALKIVGLENQIVLTNFELANDWTVRYIPEHAQTGFSRQEETIKDQIKTFMQYNT